MLLTSHGSDSTQVGSSLSFILDGVLVHEFVQVNYYGTVKYTVPTYRNTSMEMGMHNLTVQSSNTLLDGSQVVRAAAVFDYAVYGWVAVTHTHLYSIPSAHRRFVLGNRGEDGVNPDDDGHDVQTGMLVISIILSAGMLCVMLVLFFFLRLRARHRRTVLKADPWRAPSLVITFANNSDAVSEHRRSVHTDRLGEPASGMARNDKAAPVPQKQVGWPGTLQRENTSSQFPIAEMRRGSASRLESGVNRSTGVNLRASLMVGVGNVLGRNSVESMDVGFMRRRSTLSRLGIPLESSPVIDRSGLQRSLTPIAESAHSSHQTTLAAAVPTKRRCTVGESQARINRDSLRAEAGSPYEEVQDDRALIKRLESEIRLLRAEREVRLDWAGFGFGEGRGDGRDHCDEELPDYDSIV